MGDDTAATALRQPVTRGPVSGEHVIDVSERSDRADRLHRLRTALERIYGADWELVAIAERKGPPATSHSHLTKGRRSIGDAVLSRLARGYCVNYEAMGDYLDGRIDIEDMIDLCVVGLESYKRERMSR